MAKRMVSPPIPPVPSVMVLSERLGKSALRMCVSCSESGGLVMLYSPSLDTFGLIARESWLGKSS